MATGTVRGIVLAVIVLGLFPDALSVLAGSLDRRTVSVRVFRPDGRELGVLVDGRLRPNPMALESVDLVPCSPAIERGPIWAFCRDGFYFTNIFQFRKYLAAKRTLARYTGPVVLLMAGTKNPSYLEEGSLR